MNILFLSKYFYPHIGGVETHTLEIAKALVKSGHKVTVITEKYSNDLKDKETYGGIKIIRFSYPHIKFLGIKFIWWWFLVHRDLIQKADVVHCHDVLVWYMFSRIIFPTKKVYTTFHGWEGVWPIPWQNIFLKRFAAKLSYGTIAVGEYIGKYYGVNPDIVTYGGVNSVNKKFVKNKNSIVFVGRLEKDTGVNGFIKSLEKHKYKKIEFAGDGSLREECEKYGKVYGFTDPKLFLQKAEYVVPGGYLGYMEARAYGCKTITFADNKLKKDYWKEIEKVNKFVSWDNVASDYLKLWGFKI